MEISSYYISFTAAAQIQQILLRLDSTKHFAKPMEQFFFCLAAAPVWVHSTRPVQSAIVASIHRTLYCTIEIHTIMRQFETSQVNFCERWNFKFDFQRAINAIRHCAGTATVRAKRCHRRLQQHIFICSTHYYLFPFKILKCGTSIHFYLFLTRLQVDYITWMSFSTVFFYFVSYCAFTLNVERVYSFKPRIDRKIELMSTVFTFYASIN